MPRVRYPDVWMGDYVPMRKHWMLGNVEHPTAFLENVPDPESYERMKRPNLWGQREGYRHAVTIAPGVVSMRTQHPHRDDRNHQREVSRRERRLGELVGVATDEVSVLPANRRGSIRQWSSASRRRMIQRIGELDLQPLLTNDDGTPGRVGMVTLTYPGDWLTVAPSAAVTRRHFEALRLRWQRRWGVRLRCIWKREFQRRGAPHYHFLANIPADADFAGWLSNAWADIVDAPDPIERNRHRLAGTGLDFVQGAKVVNIRELAAYFAKHGAFSGKEYQNLAPTEWAEDETVGRFWGVIGLDRLAHSVELDPEVYWQMKRVLRRISQSRHARREVIVWRKKYTERVDPTTGEITVSWRWIKRRSHSRTKAYLSGRSGHLMASDGPRLAEDLARYADLLLSQ